MDQAELRSAEVSIAILAGGQSRRMGRDKGLVQLGARPMVEHVHRATQSVGHEVFVVTNQPEAYAFLGLRTVSDQEPGRGSLEGLRTALRGARTEHILVVACDMPFVRPELVAHLARKAGSADAVVPRFQGQLQPFLALYNRSCLPAIERALAQNQLEVRAILRQFDRVEVEEPELRAHDSEGISFYNVNTPEELERAQVLLERLER